MLPLFLRPVSNQQKSSSLLPVHKTMSVVWGKRVLYLNYKELPWFIPYVYSTWFPYIYIYTYTNTICLEKASSPFLPIYCIFVLYSIHISRVIHWGSGIKVLLRLPNQCYLLTVDTTWVSFCSFSFLWSKFERSQNKNTSLADTKRVLRLNLRQGKISLVIFEADKVRESSFSSTWRVIFFFAFFFLFPQEKQKHILGILQDTKNGSWNYNEAQRSREEAKNKWWWSAWTHLNAYEDLRRESLVVQQYLFHLWKEVFPSFCLFASKWENARVDRKKKFPEPSKENDRVK